MILRGLCRAYLHGNDMRCVRARVPGAGDDTERGWRELERERKRERVAEATTAAVVATIGAARFVYRG